MDTDLPARNDRLVSNSSGNLKPSAVATASGGHSQAGPAAGRDGGQATAEKPDAASKEAVSGLGLGKGLTVKVMAEDKHDSLGVSPAVERLRSRCALPHASCMPAAPATGHTLMLSMLLLCKCTAT